MAVSVKQISRDGPTTKLLVKGVDAAFLNGVRRAAMADVPVLAIESLHIYENDSVVFDEFLGHRLAMLPLKTDPKRYKAGDKVTLMLEKEGPATVYSRDIKCTDPKVEVVDKRVPLTKLTAGQKVRMEMEAVAGLGREHAKWQPAIFSYHELPKASFDMKNIKAPKKLLEAAPTALELKAGKLTVKDPTTADVGQLSKARDLAPEGVKLEFDESAFVVTLEAVGALDASQVLVGAVEALKEKTKELKKELKDL